MNKFKLMLMSCGVFAVPSLFAEGTTPSMDIAEATTMLTSAQTGLSALLTAAAPIVTTIVLAGLAIWAAIVLVRIVKRAFSRAA